MKIANHITSESRAILKKYRSKHKVKLRYLRLIESDWPCSLEIMTRLLSFITDAFNINDEPIVFRAINHGLYKYSANLGEDDPDRFRSFVQGMFDSVSRDFEHIGVHDTQSSKMWSPVASVGFGGWIADNQVSPRIQNLNFVRFDNPAENISCSFVEKMLDEEQGIILSGGIEYLAEDKKYYV